MMKNGNENGDDNSESVGELKKNKNELWEDELESRNKSVEVQTQNSK